MESLSRQEKDIISDNLRAYVAKYPSQNKAVGSLKNINQCRYGKQHTERQVREHQ